MATVEIQSPTNVLLENCPNEALNIIQDAPENDNRADYEIYQQEKEKFDESHDDHMISLEVQSETNMPSEYIHTEKPNGTSEAPEVLEIKDHEEEVDQESKEKDETINDNEIVALEVERKLDIIEKKQEKEAELQEEKEGKEESDNNAKKEAQVVPIEDSNEMIEVIVDNVKGKEEAKNEKFE